MVAGDAGGMVQPWLWIDLLRSFVHGEPCAVGEADNVVDKVTPKVMHSPIAKQFPVAAGRSGGDCGPATAAWLLNEHGPILYQSKSPETCASVRKALQLAWKSVLAKGNDVDSSEAMTFVQQRLEQVPEASLKETLGEQVELVLEYLLHGEPDVASDSGPVPYWLLPTDWVRLAEAYQVDFVLHGLPGTGGRQCGHCGTAGHLHVGPREPGVDFCLHVCWRSGGESRGEGHLHFHAAREETKDAEEPEAECSPNLRVSRNDASKADDGGNIRPLKFFGPQSPHGPAAGDAECDPEGECFANLATTGAIWGHWEPLGSGPILTSPQKGAEQASGEGGDATPESIAKALSQTRVFGEEPAKTGGVRRRRPGRLFSEVSSPLGGEASAEASAVEPLNAHHWDALAGLACLSGGALSCACREACPVVDGCCGCDDVGGNAGSCLMVPQRCAVTGPVAFKEAHGPESIEAAAPDKHDVPMTPKAVASPSVQVATPATGGARFCVLLDQGAPQLLPAKAGSGGDAASLARFREDFALAVAAAGRVALARVRVLDVGAPLITNIPASSGRGLRRRAQPPGRPSPKVSAAAVTKLPAAPGFVDTGAGVLSFLLAESPEPPTQSGCSSQASTTAEESSDARESVGCWNCVRSPGGVQSARGDVRFTGSEAACVRGVAVRILAMIREPTGGSEELSAMQALHLVGEALADSSSPLQEALRPWVASDCGAAARLDTGAGGPGPESRRLRQNRTLTVGQLARGQPGRFKSQAHPSLPAGSM
mmetsp:Transcript_124603/g.265782  ORF Transcript_124603/g.265782 Transcript_124603/m.265782 type:complete len:769 (-) Transcript_124603:155-2461(-)